MDQVTKVRKCLNREEWKFLIKECRSSGMTVTAWCKLNGICEQTYVSANNNAVRYKNYPNPLRVGVIHYISHVIFERLEFFAPSASSAS